MIHTANRRGVRGFARGCRRSARPIDVLVASLVLALLAGAGGARAEESSGPSALPPPRIVDPRRPDVRVPPRPGPDARSAKGTAPAPLPLPLPAAAPLRDPPPLPPPAPLPPDAPAARPMPPAVHRIGLFPRFRLALSGTFTIPPSPEGRVGEDVGSPDPSFDWGALDLGLAFGGDLSLAWAPDPRHQFELRATYFGDAHDDTRQAGALGYRDAPGGTGMATALDAAKLAWSSQLLSAEASWRMITLVRGNHRLEAIAGLRALYADDETSLSDFAQPIDPGFAGVPRIDADSDATLGAVQVGAAFGLRPSSRLSLTVTGKVFAGVAHGRVVVRDESIFASGSHRTTVEETDLGWGLEGEVALAWHLDGRWAVVGSYGVLWVDGLPDLDAALDFTEAATGAVRARWATDDRLLHVFRLGFAVTF